MIAGIGRFGTLTASVASVFLGANQDKEQSEASPANELNRSANASRALKPGCTNRTSNSRPGSASRRSRLCP